ncbi:hypothetical protein SPSIL_009500 [Sporomusa silvacetica DSM 10669]|uniref:Zinc-ribbon domain-containing protein n=1 Tax=Sporomusa silvacetica DSM 10669 TaxID=1123289 RepID=A0ABZ3IGQ8_9FIRM|nr:hypothetical protein [Sporomusa silvacetica]OZC13090.1 hypothetical protein SPSIL_55460 [Sporomusa silvacetica DSM 10669]
MPQISLNTTKPVICPQCKKVNIKGSTKCKKCGADLTAKQE